MFGWASWMMRRAVATENRNRYAIGYSDMRIDSRRLSWRGESGLRGRLPPEAVPENEPVSRRGTSIAYEPALVSWSTMKDARFVGGPGRVPGVRVPGKDGAGCSSRTWRAGPPSLGESSSSLSNSVSSEPCRPRSMPDSVPPSPTRCSPGPGPAPGLGVLPGKLTEKLDGGPPSGSETCAPALVKAGVLGSLGATGDSPVGEAVSGSELGRMMGVPDANDDLRRA